MWSHRAVSGSGGPRSRGARPPLEACPPRRDQYFVSEWRQVRHTGARDDLGGGNADSRDGDRVNGATEGGLPQRRMPP
jgi:hypothetical protein